MLSHSREVQLLEVIAVSCFITRKQPRHFARRNRALLKATLGEHRHLHPEHGANATRHDLTFQGIQPLVRSSCQRREWSRLPPRDDGVMRIRTERMELVLRPARIPTHAPSAEPPGVREWAIYR